MIKSMTGYGKADSEFQNKKFTVEIKSLNSKQLDLNLKVPSIYKDKEMEFRNEISKELVRGKVDLYISVDSVEVEQPTSFNAALITTYYNQIANLSKQLDIPVSDNIMSTLLRMPDVLKPEKQEVSDDEWLAILTSTRKAIKMLNEFRDQEGKALEKDINDRISIITTLSDSLTPYETNRIERLKQKMRQNLSEWVSSGKIDENRFEQELIYYIEKLDITEEKVRLANHCVYFSETMEETESSGKKLAFIIQEIGREINTIGSKSNDSNMQKIVVQMKDELEKIKEQLNNIL